jgi:hypothetical protein
MFFFSSSTTSKPNRSLPKIIVHFASVADKKNFRLPMSFSTDSLGANVDEGQFEENC